MHFDAKYDITPHRTDQPLEPRCFSARDSEKMTPLEKGLIAIVALAATGFVGYRIASGAIQAEHDNSPGYVEKAKDMPNDSLWKVLYMQK